MMSRSLCLVLSFFVFVGSQTSIAKNSISPKSFEDVQLQAENHDVFQDILEALNRLNEKVEQLNSAINYLASPVFLVQASMIVSGVGLSSAVLYKALTCVIRSLCKRCHPFKEDEVLFPCATPTSESKHYSWTAN